MGVPAEVRAVKRPVNTVVEDSGRDTPLRYAVRARAFSKYVPGGNPQPHNGKVVGHIINLQYVPIVPKMETEPDILSYGAGTGDYRLDPDHEYRGTVVVAGQHHAGTRIDKPADARSQVDEYSAVSCGSCQ